jgi:uncharacterized Zn finger protein (UPF0148 family)
MEILLLFGVVVMEKIRLGGITMVKRKCPKCDTVRYSAVTSPWRCPNCGMILTSEFDLPLDSETKSAREQYTSQQYGGQMA